uniref:Alpha-galactosidase n=1 Tax=Tetraselmis chuii TaxID=63592 RepID=A0A7S1SIE2_9CHLO
MNWGPASLAGVGIVHEPAKLYQAMHKYLADAGVTGVKVDCQAGVGLVPRQGGGPASALASHTALEESVAEHFPGNHLINCMCHSTENFYRYKWSAIARACDDFYPRDPASHTSHIGNAAYNSLFLGVLVHPDWDMFQSKHPAAQLHAVARAASGSAVYVSDKPGEHDFALLRRLVLPDGTVLRPLLPGLPTADILFNDPMCDGNTLLKVWNVNHVSALVGVFNVQGASWDRSLRRFHIHDDAPSALWTRVRPADVWAFRRGSRGAPTGHQGFVLWQSVQLKLNHAAGPTDHILVRLSPGGSELVTVVPVMAFDGVRFAAIGLCELFNPGAAVTSCELEPHNGTRKVVVGLRGYGAFRCYCNRRPKQCELNSVNTDHIYDEEAEVMEVAIPRQAVGGTSSLAVTF